MKGFIYLLEISIALILMLVVLGTISSFQVKESWERADLVAVVDNIIKTLKNEDVLEILNGNLDKIKSLIPPNVDFGIKVYGIPKNNISVGCVQYCNFVDDLLTDSYVNNHWINFTVEQFDIDSLNYIPSHYDAVVLVNYIEYTIRKSNITDYLNKGGVVIGINATFNNNDIDFNEIFGLNPTSPGSGNFHFTAYNPSEDEIEKYFLGLGFGIKTDNVIDSKKWGYWYIWEDSRMVNITPSVVNIENKTIDEGIIQNMPEDGFFNLKGPDNEFYTFKVKKIFWDNNVIIQPKNTSFIFKDFSEANDVAGKINIITSNGQTEMASNNTAVWISDFSQSDEYNALVKAAIASRVKEWYIKEPDLTKEHVAVSSFYTLCCDMPETTELTFYLWYKI